MQSTLLFSLVALGLIILIVAVDLLRSRARRPHPQRVEQKPHTESRADALKTADTDVSEEEHPTPTPAEALPEQRPEQLPEQIEAESPPEAIETEQAAPANLFGRLKSGLSRTRNQLTASLSDLVLGKKEIDEELFEEIETLLLTADIGIDATTRIVNAVTEKSNRNELKDSESLYQALKQELSSLLSGHQAPLEIDTSKAPYVILVVGVNGVGKTTTIGKMAKRFQNQGHSVMLAAGDTFRAAAVEQLQVWGERNDVPVVAQHTGADSASVIFDAVESARSRGIDVVIADTAGRLQNKDNLMNELSKVVRVMQKLDDSAPHEVMLVLDAGTGQNAISQAQVFREAVGVTGLSLTKLDGTAKGGIIFAIAEKHKLPIRFIGVGEQIDDLRPFDADDFVNALFDA